MVEEIHQSLNQLLNLPRYVKKLIVIILDICLCFISLWLALLLRLDSYQFSLIDTGIYFAAIVSVFSAIPIFWLMGLYRTMFRFSGTNLTISIFFPILIYTLVYFSFTAIFVIKGIPRSVGIIQPILLFFSILMSRLCAVYLFSRVSKEYLKNKKINFIPRALIYGAGKAGTQLFSSLENSNQVRVLGFIDDDQNLQNQTLLGKKIYSSLHLKKIIQKKNISHVLLALPRIDKKKRSEIIKKITALRVIVRTLPNINEIVGGKVTASDIKDLIIDDILDREQHIPNMELLKKNIESKVVIVTGAGGSIGAELCRQIFNQNPKKLLMIENNEFALYNICLELEEKKSKIIDCNIEIISLLASIQDINRMEEIVALWKPDTFYHAAAFKHVSLVEENVCEGIKNNIFGSLNCAKVAIDNNVSDFVLISSDKAVRPTNIMGATKRLSEIFLLAYFDKFQKKSNLTLVRFGNVLESSGSVIPKFRKQILNGGPVTLTHPEVTRYFMTVQEAAQLVIQAGAMSRGQEVFILDMGEPVKIKDLTERIINLSGLTIKDINNPEGDIEIKIIGLRPEEKLNEELLLGNNPQPTTHHKIKKAQELYPSWENINSYLEKLEISVKKSHIVNIVLLMQELISDFKPSNLISDIIYKNQESNKSFKDQISNKVVKIK